MITLATIAFNAPRATREQLRLVAKYLEDPHQLIVFDQSSEDKASREIEKACKEYGIELRRLQTRMHHEGLNTAASVMLDGDAPYIGFLDHDIFPTRPTKLIPFIEKTGFYGVGQRHAPTNHLYLWPGFCFFSRSWLDGRSLDFNGIRGKHKRDDGDTGSGMWRLFQNEDWKNLYQIDHGYRVLREPDDYGLQSFGYEVIGDWLHLSNGSGWMKIPNPEEREKLAMDLLASL